MAPVTLTLSGRRCRLSTADDLAFSFFRQELGEPAGKGRVLVTRADLDLLDLDALHTLTWGDQAGRTAVLRGLVVSREPECLSPDALGDPEAVYSVELADSRWRVHNPTSQQAVNASYNVRLPSGYGGDYYPATLAGGAAWTWGGMIEDLWDLVAPQLGAWPGLPFSPDGVPEGWQFVGSSAWLAVCKVLRRIGCAVRLDLTAASNQASIVRVGAADAAADALLAAAERSWRKLHDGEFPGIVRGKGPAGWAVTFYRRDAAGGGGDWPPNSAYVVNVDSVDVGRAEPGVYAPIIDDLPALYDAGVLTNLADLEARAAERGADADRMLRNGGGQRLLKTYSGVLVLAPGATIKAVAYRLSAEGGVVTDVARHPLPALLDLSRCCEGPPPLPFPPPAPWAPAEPTYALPVGTTPTTATISADTHDYALPATNWLRATVTTAASLTGIVATSTNYFQFVTNLGTAVLTFPNASGSSSAGNRFETPGGISYDLTPGNTVLLFYDLGAAAWKLTPVGGDPTVQALNLDADLDDLSLTLPRDCCPKTLSVNPTAPGLSLTGFDTPPPVGVPLNVVNVGTESFTLPAGGASAFPLLPAGATPVTLNPGQSVLVTYNGVELRPVAQSDPATGAAPTADAQYVETGGATLAATTTETTLLSAGGGSLTVPAGDLDSVGACLLVEAQGTIQTDPGGSGIQFRLKFGGTTVWDGGSVTLLFGTTSVFALKVYLVCTATGATGTLHGRGQQLLPLNSSAAEWNYAESSNTVDFTGALTLDLTAQWGNNGAGNTTTLKTLSVTRLKP